MNYFVIDILLYSKKYFHLSQNIKDGSNNDQLIS